MSSSTHLKILLFSNNFFAVKTKSDQTLEEKNQSFTLKELIHIASHILLNRKITEVRKINIVLKQTLTTGNHQVRRKSQLH